MKQTRFFFLSFFLHFFIFSLNAAEINDIPLKIETSCTWGAPLNFQASQITPTAITFVWNHPAQGAAPKGYSLNIINTNTGVLVDSVSLNGTTQTFSGLAMGTYYTAEIRSICSDGQVSDFFARTTIPTIILDEIVNSLCTEPGNSTNPTGSLMSVQINNLSSSSSHNWVGFQSNSNNNIQMYYFKIFDPVQTTKYAKFIVYRELNGINFHFKKKASSGMNAVLTPEKTIKLYKGTSPRGTLHINLADFKVINDATNVYSFNVLVDLWSSCFYAQPFSLIESISTTPDEIANSDNGLIIKEIKKMNGIRVYPNPVKEILRLNWEFNGLEPFKLEIISANGIKLIDKDLDSTEDMLNQTLELNVDNLEEGIYFIRISTSNEVFTSKFIKAG